MQERDVMPVLAELLGESEDAHDVACPGLWGRVGSDQESHDDRALLPRRKRVTVVAFDAPPQDLWRFTVSTTMSIAGQPIGRGHPTYFIAEMSANHDGSLERAIELLESCVDAGVDAVKLQTYTADTLTLNSDAPAFRVSGGTLWDGRTLHDLYTEAAMPWEWQPILKKRGEELGVQVFSSPFDQTAIDFLEEMNVPAYKVASAEITDTGLITAMATTGKPLIISTGLASLEEIAHAVTTAREAGATQIALLKCTSAYPAPPSDINLRTINHMAEAFNVPVGLSDHTLDIAVPLAAVALGASIIEKHVTLDRNAGGPDSSFSLEMDDLQQLIHGIRTVEAAIGDVTYGPTEHETAGLRFRRSLYVSKDITAGDIFTTNNIRSVRPTGGLPPNHLPQILGRQATTALTHGDPLQWEDVGGAN